MCSFEIASALGTKRLRRENNANVHIYILTPTFYFSLLQRHEEQSSIEIR